MDTFVEDRRRIDNSGIETVFTPSCPINQNLFCGREKEAQSIIEGLCQPGAHVILYGDRGVGKTSLAQFACTKLLEVNGSYSWNKIICSSDDTFETVMEKVFKTLGITFEDEVSKSKNAGINTALASFGGSKSSTIHCYCQISNPGWCAEHLANQKCVLLIDEFDTIATGNAGEKQKFSQLMKILSDNTSPVKLFIVGISSSVDDLLEGHRSVGRALNQVHLNRMLREELLDIIQKGEEKTNLHFDTVVKDKIVDYSLGLPYFTHLISLYSSRKAVVEERREVSIDDFNEGLQQAIDNADVSLRESYRAAVGINDNLLKKEIVYAASQAGARGRFTMNDWLDAYAKIFDKKIVSVTINSKLQNSINKPDSLLKSIRRGVYIFNDSRMPSYINLLGKPEDSNN